MAALTAQVQAAGPVPAAAPSSTQLAATITSLADLRDRNAITELEYEAKKRDILARI